MAKRLNALLRLFETPETINELENGIPRDSKASIPMKTKTNQPAKQPFPSFFFFASFFTITSTARDRKTGSIFYKSKKK